MAEEQSGTVTMKDPVSGDFVTVPKDQAPEVSVPRLVPGGGGGAAKRAIFKSDRSKPAGQLSYAGYIWKFTRWSDDVAKAQEAWAAQTAEKLGVTLDQFNDPEIKYSGDQLKIFEDESEKLWDLIIVDTHHGWSGGDKLSPDELRDLFPDIKKTLGEFIISFLHYGIREEEFFSLGHRRFSR